MTLQHSGFFQFLRVASSLTPNLLARYIVCGGAADLSCRPTVHRVSGKIVLWYKPGPDALIEAQLAIEH